MMRTASYSGLIQSTGRRAGRLALPISIALSGIKRIATREERGSGRQPKGSVQPRRAFCYTGPRPNAAGGGKGPKTRKPHGGIPQAGGGEGPAGGGGKTG